MARRKAPAPAARIPSSKDLLASLPCQPGADNEGFTLHYTAFTVQADNGADDTNLCRVPKLSLPRYPHKPPESPPQAAESKTVAGCPGPGSLSSPPGQQVPYVPAWAGATSRAARRPRTRLIWPCRRTA